MGLAKTIFICLLLGLSISSVAAEETIRLASGEWPPYQSQSLEHAGVVSRIVREAFAFGGVRVELGYFPWKRAFFLAEEGLWDGTFVWFDLPERREHFYVSDAVVDIAYVFFHLKSVPFDWQTIDDLDGFRIGGTLGYDYGVAFQQAEQRGRLQVVRKPTDEENFARLFDALIHLFPCDRDAGYALIHTRFSADDALRFTHHPRALKKAPHHLLLSRKVTRNQRMLRLFNSGLKRLRASGAYEQYFAESRRGDYRRQSPAGDGE